MSDSGGRWITMRGTHVFVKDGQSPMDAYIKKTAKRNSNVKTYDNDEELIEDMATADITRGDLEGVVQAYAIKKMLTPRQENELLNKIDKKRKEGKK